MENKSGYEIVNVNEWQSKIKNFNLLTMVGIKKKLIDTALRIESETRENAPVRTGYLKANYFVNDENIDSYEISVETETLYAPFVELGTRYMEAQPHLQPALEANRGEFYASVQKVVKDSW